MSKDLVLGNDAVTSIVEAIKHYPVLKEEDVLFLQENKAHLAAVMENTHIWRTDVQKMSIISDSYHPTLHSKFHQAILEQKVQFEQSLYLAKDFELKKLEIEELECDLEDLTDSKRDGIKSRKIQVEIQFKQFELKNMQIAMKYRMSEVKGWQNIENVLLEKMRSEGVPEETIWNKNEGEVSAMFLQTLTNLRGLEGSSDAAERTNLVALARFAVQQAKQMGVYEKLKPFCNPDQLQSLQFLEQA